MRAAETRLGKEKSRLRRAELTKLVEEARAALSRTDSARALEVLKSLPPELAAEPDLASEARALQAQASRIESQLAARRQALREAKEQISGNNFVRAIEILEKAVAVAGQSSELTGLLQYARERKAEQHRQELVRQLLAQAHQLQDDHKYDDAARILEQAQGELNAAEIAVALASVREKQRQFEEHQRETQWRKVIDEAKVAIKRMAYQRAIDLLAALPPEVESIPELVSAATVLLGEARLGEQRLSVSREAVRVAQEQLQAGDYLRAIETVEKALVLVGQSTELAGLLKLAREKAEQVRQERLRGILDQARQLQRDGKYEEAVSLLEHGQRESGAKEIDSLLSTVKEQRRLAQQRDEVLQQARQLLAAGQAAKVRALLDAAPKSFLENDELRRIYAACREKLERANFVRSNGVRIETLLSSGDVAQARTLLHSALKKYPDESALLALQARLQQAESGLRHAEGMKRLLAIEQKVSSAKRSRLKGLAHQVQQIAASHSADDEANTFAARVRQRIEAETASPVALPNPLPWGRVALGIASAAALVAGIELGPHFFGKRPGPVEIRSDPPGASVRIGDRSCIAPNCRFELLPGQYQVQAELNGFETLHRTLRLDSQPGPHSLDLTLQPVPPPAQPSTRAVTLGTLVVRVSLPDALIMSIIRRAGALMLRAS